jgi:hypothetical protein
VGSWKAQSAELAWSPVHSQVKAYGEARLSDQFIRDDFEGFWLMLEMWDCSVEKT